jgi:hypothetical protein
MIDWHAELNDSQKAAVRLLADASRRDAVEVHVFDRQAGLTKSDRDRLLYLLASDGHLRLKPKTTPSHFYVHGSIAHVLHRIDNPPPPDYWQLCTRAVRTKKWSVALAALGGAIAVVGGTLSIVRTFL